MRADGESRAAAVAEHWLRQLDELCDRFESAWKIGERPIIEKHLSDLPQLQRMEALRELIALDADYRWIAGESPTVQEYAARFPALDRAWLEALLESKPARPAHSEQPPGSPPRVHSPIGPFAQGLAECGLMSAASLAAFLESITPADRPHDAESLARALVERQRLTKYQAAMIYQGKAKNLLLMDYILLDKLGQGGMGTVFRARHRRMDRMVALKVLRSSAMKQRQAVERFHREVKAAARLAHPNIVHAYDAGESNGHYYLVMEYVDGNDLAAIVKKNGPLEIDRAVDYVLQAAYGLAYAHGQGIVHRDIKPHNLLLDRSGTVKILDMGLARFDPNLGNSGEKGLAATAVTELTQSGVIMGTVDYMAPEQAMDTRKADHRADIYSLGCTLHFLLTGRSLYVVESMLAALVAHQHNPVVSLREARPDAPAALDRVFQKMIAKKPDERQQSMTDVIAELREALTDHGDRQQFLRDSAATFLEPSVVAEAGDWLEQIARNQTGIEPDKTHAASATSRAGGTTSILANPRSRAWLAGAVAGLAFFAFAVTLSVNAFRGDSNPPSVESNQQAEAPAAPTVESTMASVAPIGPIAEPDDVPPVEIPREAEDYIEALLAPDAVDRSEPSFVTKAEKLQAECADKLEVLAKVKNRLGMTMVLIPPGEFLMGARQQDFEEFGLRNEQPHLVRITEPFRMSATEVTVGQFEQFVKAKDYVTDAERTGGFGLEGGRWIRAPGYSWLSLGEQERTNEHPAASISWNDATAFCEWLSKEEGIDYVLPTEAQWEFACRAGSPGRFCFGDSWSDVPVYAWFGGNSGGRLHPVTKKRPNVFGLYDMHGNEWEWCADYYDPNYYASSPKEDPTGPLSGRGRTQRGGGMLDPPQGLRSSMRRGKPQNSPEGGSFRVTCWIRK